jgi:hypothetical protein
MNIRPRIVEFDKGKGFSVGVNGVDGGIMSREMVFRVGSDASR